MLQNHSFTISEGKIELNEKHVTTFKKQIRNMEENDLTCGKFLWYQLHYILT